MQGAVAPETVPLGRARTPHSQFDDAGPCDSCRNCSQPSCGRVSPWIPLSTRPHHATDFGASAGLHMERTKSMYLAPRRTRRTCKVYKPHRTLRDSCCSVLWRARLVPVRIAPCLACRRLALAPSAMPQKGSCNARARSGRGSQCTLVSSRGPVGH